MQIAFKLGMFLALSALSAAHAQNPEQASQAVPATLPVSQAAPIVRGYSNGGPARSVQGFDAQPVAGVFVRSDVHNGVQTVSSTTAGSEIRITQGRANVTVHHPQDRSQILVDLPGGQVSLLKDGLYTFNAATNTVRVLHGEAEAYNTGSTASKGTKVKETQQLAFFGNAKLRSVNAYPYELTADLLPGGGRGRGDGMENGPYRNGFYGDGPYYGDAPYYAGAYGYPYGGLYPYDYGFGYPFGVGFGFGYGGGFRGGYGGGFRGGFRR